MADLRSLFALSRSAVVQAGAGTGKTHNLVTLCLHLLGGAGRAEPLPPARLCAVTFTEKAAAELKGRIRERVDALAECAPEDVARIEPELAAAGSPPAASLWRRVRRDLGAAQIGTIHSLCGQILRRHAAAAGLDPGFAVLDEIDARQIRADACLSAALDALEDSGPARDAARRLCAELGLRAPGRFGRGLADELAFLLGSLGEGGREVAEIVEATPGLHAAETVAAEAAARRAFADALDAVESDLRAGRLRRAPSPTAIKALESIEGYRAGSAALVAAAAPGELAAAWPGLRPLREALRGSLGGPTGDLIRVARDALEALVEADAQVRSARLARDLALLAGEAQRRYRAEKARAGALDFDDLTRTARDLLARDASVRREEKARLGVLLVDEFQDTSRPQLELFGWLVEDGDGVAGSGRAGARPIATGSLVVVGDRKQSIYEFRGADVAGALAFAEQALRDGAERHVLRESRRARPALVELCNRLFRSALSPGDRPFETPFGDDDALEAFRPAGAPGSCAELLDVTGSGIEVEAEVVSARIARLLAPGAAERIFEQDAPRPVRGGDVAILLRRFTNVDVFRRALLRRRIPHLVFKGRGFYGAREVVDLVQLLALAVDPDDALALLSVLRSPLGPLSDEGLVLLAQHGGGHGLRLRAARDPAAGAALSPDDAAALDRVLALVGRLQRECDRLGPAAVLEAALAETDFVAAAAGGLYGEQAAANVDKLVGLARSHELRGGSVRSFVAQVRRLAEDDAGEADAGVVEEGDPHAVRILTVHAAKGLEFPVVIVPECAAQPPNVVGNVLLDPDLGLALKVRGADGRRKWGTGGNLVRAQRVERETAQARRLFYVAATRARDLLILSGRAAPPKAPTWRQWIDEAVPACGELLRILPDGAGLDAPPPAAEPALVDREPELLRALCEGGAVTGVAPDPAIAAAVEAARVAVARAEGRGTQPDGTVVAPVTQLADASACPRRYQLLHEIGLAERPQKQGSGGEGSAAERGTLAHRLLELADLEPCDRPARREELRRLLALDGEDPSSPEHAEVVEAAVAFLESPLARRMARLGPLRLQRELPFALRLAPGDGEPPGPALVVRGQLDALLLDDGEATVVDYKLSRADAAGRYDFQLDAYALAARMLTESMVPVRTGLVYLRSAGAPFQAREPAGEAELEAVRRRLLDAARVLAEGRRTGVWPKVELHRCRAIACGFVARCHPGEVLRVEQLSAP